MLPWEPAFAQSNAKGGEVRLAETPDSVEYIELVEPQMVTDSLPKRQATFLDSMAIVQKLPKWAHEYLNSLVAGNIDRTRERTIDLSFGLSPSYTREASFGIGAMCTALYRVDRNDTLSQPSDIFACLNASLNGFYVLTVKGNNLFPNNRTRLSYRFNIYRKHLDFWGITSESSANNPKTTYDRRSINLFINYVHRLTHRFYVGGHLLFDYTDARKLHRPDYLMGERPQYYVTGVGVSAEIDSRDKILNPTQGVYISLTSMFFPKFIGNAPAFFNQHKLVIDAYTRLWKGAVLAGDFYAKINSGKTPWTMREMVAADGIRMRGYYMGSYIDNSQIAVQAELRQHIYKRFGMTVWTGCATVFSSLRDFRHKEIKPQWLPNVGIGLRYEFKHNVNARIDYGFGRHTSGLLFAIGEAF